MKAFRLELGVLLGEIAGRASKALSILGLRRPNYDAHGVIVSAARVHIKPLGDVERLDLAVLDRPSGERVLAERVDQVGLAFPEADVLDVGARRARGRGQ